MPQKIPFTQRMIEAAVSGVGAFSTKFWKDPGEPDLPVESAKKVVPLRSSFLPGINMGYFDKQSEILEGTLKQGVSFEELRMLADISEITRSIIDLCKDQLIKQILGFKLTVDPNETSEAYKERTNGHAGLKKLNELFISPDGEHTMKQWLRIIMEEFLVTDAVTIYKRTNLRGEIIGLEILDGTTIQPLLDKSGRRPVPPYPAYVQVIDGSVVAHFTSEEIMYTPRNQRINKIYGQSHVEIVATHINIGLRRLTFQLSHYTEGNMPVGIKEVPEDWTADQIDQFQKYWDAVMSGNLAQRSKLWFVPGGGKDPVFPKKDVLTDMFDEWLARILCHVFSVSPNSFIQNLNRAVSEQQREQADEEGMFSRMAFIKDTLDFLVRTWFGYEDVEAVWTLDRPQDSHKQALIDEIYVKLGIKSIDEVRGEIGQHPIGVGHAVYLSGGLVFLTGESGKATTLTLAPDPPEDKQEDKPEEKKKEVTDGAK